MKTTSTKNTMPLTIASEPLVMPTDFRSFDAKPMTLPTVVSFQYCKIKTPEVMNKAHPISEKKTSEMIGKLSFLSELKTVSGLPILLLMGVLIMYPAKTPTKMMVKPTKVPLMIRALCMSLYSAMLL